ncbi:MAG: SLBB domain-containing protein [Pyrinomonadaceae bacterium]
MMTSEPHVAPKESWPARSAAKYRKYQRNPQVDVFVKEFQSQPVALIGAVDKPGRFQLQRRMRLLELLTFAGGPLERAGGRIHLIRTEARCGAMNRSSRKVT